VEPGLEPGQMLKLRLSEFQVEEDFRLELQLQMHQKVFAQEEDLNRA